MFRYLIRYDSQKYVTVLVYIGSKVYQGVCPRVVISERGWGLGCGAGGQEDVRKCDVRYEGGDGGGVGRHYALKLG